MGHMLQSVRSRAFLYFLINLVFVVLVGSGAAAGGDPDPRWAYLILLFALCTTAIIDFDRLNGRYALLALFMFVYFVSYGAVDLVHLYAGGESTGPSNTLSHGVLSKPEAVILTGGIAAALSYRMAVYLTGIRKQHSAQNWSKTAILAIGVLLFVLGTAATYHWYVYIVTDTTVEAEQRGLASLSSGVLTLHQLGQYCQPLGLLLVVYAWTVYPGVYTIAIMISAIVLQMLLGFIIDIKGMAMQGIILLIVTGILVRGRVPKVWVVVGVMFVTFVYPLFTSYRAVIHGAGISRTSVVQNFGAALQKSIASKDKVNTGRYRAQTFLERSSVKDSVEVIVGKTGDTVAFQNGHTLAPVLYAFVPKLLWSNKEQVESGRLLNREFHFTDSESQFISPSYLGEFYWNFGWAGVIACMAALGLTCGWVGAAFTLVESATVTRALILMITIKQLIVGFEGSVSDNCVVWLRSLAAIGILHLVFARAPSLVRLVSKNESGEVAEPATHRRSERPFPNLLT